MTRGEAVNWLINIMADIGKAEHSELWHYEQALSEIREMLESAQPERCEDCKNFSKTRLLIPQPEIIRCKDCRWWDKFDDYDNGYCMAAKHCYWSSHWEISIRRKYKGDFYCADAEPKGYRNEQ